MLGDTNDGGALFLTFQIADGEPVTPMVFWQWKPEPYEVEHFSAAGLSLFSFFGSTQHYDHRQRVQPLFLESVPA